MDYMEEFKEFLASQRGGEIQAEFEDFNVFTLINQCNQIEADRLHGDLLRYDLAVFSQVVSQYEYPESKEEARALYERIIDSTIPCYDPADGDYIYQGDHKTMLQAVMSLSFVLSRNFPAYFFPNFYRYKFYELRQVLEACGIQLPPMPARTDYRGRCMYYWHLCDALYDFRMKHNLISVELWVFIYAYLPLCLPRNSWTVPEASAAWWLGKREAIDEYLPTVLTHLRPSAKKGDIVVRYEAAPVQAVTGLWRVLSDIILDPFDPQYSGAYVGQQMMLKAPLTLRELQADARFAKHPLCRKNFLSSDGYKLSQEDFDYLLDMLQEKGLLEK